MSKEKVLKDNSKTFRKIVLDLFENKNGFKEVLSDVSNSFLSLSKKYNSLNIIFDLNNVEFNSLDKEFQRILKEEFSGVIKEYKKIDNIKAK